MDLVRGYIYISLILAVFDIFFAWMCFRKEGMAARYLGYTALGGAAVDITYLLSVLTSNYIIASVMSSAYFASIDWMLLGVITFVHYYTNRAMTPKREFARKIVTGYAAFETIVFAINPIWEIAVSYVDTGTAFARYVYEMKPLYVMHLAFTYCLVIYVLFALVRRHDQAPRQYRSQYAFIILGIVAIVAINALFLYIPMPPDLLPHLDFSILGYSLILILMYLSCFEYTKGQMVRGLSVTVFENIGQGIALFDYEGFLVMKNERAVQLLRTVEFKDRMSMLEFMRQCGIRDNVEGSNKEYSVQCYFNDNGRERAARCDYRPLRDRSDKLIGNLFVFTDAELETDLLTGFHKWENFKIFAVKNRTARKKSVAVFDINALGVINTSQGVDEGDRRIRQLAEAIRRNTPAETYYVRGQDAVLIAVCFDVSAIQMAEYAQKIQADYEGSIQFAVSHTDETEGDVVAAIDRAMDSLQIKKLLDSGSNHSQALTSLVRALQECDSDTEAHVQRTQRTGQALGARIGLSDSEQSHLRLLCLLHDIGKIGIPLDILNKPSKLTDDEWTIVRSHVHKGYQIALSSDKLSCIADMILHHHERWDGKGYPDGLSRESIPLLSRIISVVDAYDAMTNERPYQRAIPVEQALDELRRCAGSQFDPYITSEFITMISESREETAAVPDEPKERELPSALRNINEQEAEDAAAAAGVYPVLFSRYLLDDEERIVEIDPNFTKITGYTEEDIRRIQLDQFGLIPEDVRTEYLALVSSLISRSSMVYLEHKLQRKDGSTTFVFCVAEKIYDAAAKARRTKIIISDISSSYSARMVAMEEKDKSQQRLRHWEDVYRRDLLTGLLNHIAFQNDAEQLLLAEQKKLLLMMLDVDHFKEFNDTYGHDEGDALLKLLGGTVKDSVGEDGIACRMGGDEFALILPYEPDDPEEQMLERAQEIFCTITDSLQGYLGSKSISAGVVVSDRDTTNFKNLYRRADQALYASKQNGRSRLTVAEELGVM